MLKLDPIMSPPCVACGAPRFAVREETTGDYRVHTLHHSSCAIQLRVDRMKEWAFRLALPAPRPMTEAEYRSKIKKRKRKLQHA